MTEQELTYNINQELRCCASNFHSISESRLAILALLSEAGWKSPEEVFNQTLESKKSGWDDCEKWYKAEGYVKLADLTLPENPYPKPRPNNPSQVSCDRYYSYKRGQEDMLKAGFKKVEEEK